MDHLGVHVLPKHYYTPIPDYVWLRQNKHLWSGRLGLNGIVWDLEEQIRWLSRICEPYYHEVDGLEFYQTATGRKWGPGYGPIESQVLHCVIRSLVPRKVMEIGSGVSTACMLNASAMNAREGRTPTEMVCIEPFPRHAFRELAGIRHINTCCQAVPQAVFDELQAGDLLFIDSSHAVKTGSEVTRIYLEILPRLRPGVLIHIHDIYLPYAYPRDTLVSYFGWQETVLVTALLTDNPRFSICACLSALHYDYQRELGEILHNYEPQLDSNGLAASSGGHFPASLWLRSVETPE